MSVFDTAVKKISDIVGVTAAGQATNANSLPVVISSDQLWGGKTAADFGSSVFPAGAVRNDADAASTTNNLQYTMLSADSTGRLKVLAKTLAVDDAAAAGEIYPIGGLYLAGVLSDEVDDGDVGRVRMTQRRALIAAPDYRYNQVAVNEVTAPGGIQCMTGAWSAQNWVAPAEVFFNGADAGFDADPRYIRIPMANWASVTITIYQTLGVNLTVSLHPLLLGYTGGDGTAAPKMASVVMGSGGVAMFTPHAGGTGADVTLYPVPALLTPMTWLLLALTPASDPSSGYIILNVSRS